MDRLHEDFHGRIFEHTWELSD